MAIHDDDLLLINDSQDSNEAKKIKFSTLKSNIGGTQNLQEVTDAGNTTTNSIVSTNYIQSNNSFLTESYENSGAGFNGDPGVRADTTGFVEIRGDNAEAFRLKPTTGDYSVVLNANGSGTFAGEIEVDGVNIGGGPGTSTINTRVGEDALDSCTSGLGNTAFGSFAAANTTTGSNNTAVGRRALLENEGGTDNTAVGINTLRDNTASNNTAVGSSALFACTSGTNNTAVGAFALDSNTGGSSNVGVGRNALGLNVSGDQNVAVGQSALGNLAGGDLNVCIGHQAGNTIGNNGSNNTIIGSLQGTVGMADTMLFGAGTTERFRVDANGRFLVGTNSSSINVNSVFQGSSSNADTQGIVAIARGSDGSGGVRTLGSLYFTNNAHTIGSQIDCNTAEGWTSTTKPAYLTFSTNDGTAGAGTQERMRIASDGRIILPDGSPGISFGSAGVASQLLDDYEEGTWTPTLTSASNVFTHTSQVGTYTKVGRTVLAHAFIEVELTTINSADGAITLQMPFTTTENDRLVTCVKVSNGGANWGAQAGQPAVEATFAAVDTTGIGIQSSALNMGFANTAWYPGSTTVRIEFNANYQTNA